MGEKSGEFKIRSLTAIKVPKADYDSGIIRVPNKWISNYFPRGSLVKIKHQPESGGKAIKLTRIVRGSRRLKDDEIALQYDDRLELGLSRAGKTLKLEIKSVNIPLGVFPFLFKHTSPVTRYQTWLRLGLMLVSIFLGFVIGKIF